MYSRVDLIKLIIFTASTETFLSKTGNFFFFTANMAAKNKVTTSTVSTTALTHAKAPAVLAFPPSMRCQPSEKGK